MLAEAGFREGKFHGWTGYVTSSLTQGALVTARKPIGGSSSGAGGGDIPSASGLSRITFPAYGIISYLIFFGTFLYMIGFLGNLLVPKSIDTGPPVPLGRAFAVDLLLLGLFGLQHSIMARPAFKGRWTRLVPAPIERSTFVLASSLVLALLVWQWRPIPEVVWEITHPVAEAGLWALFAGGWLVVLVSTFLIDHFDLFGLRQVYLHAAGKPYLPPPFRTPVLYRVVRHPIMLGFLIAFWATPVMTWGHLLFAALTTAYIFMGIRLEERDLEAAFGGTYQDYRPQVSMIFPWVKRERGE